MELLISIVGTLIVLACIPLMVYWYAKGNDHPH